MQPNQWPSLVSTVIDENLNFKNQYLGLKSASTKLTYCQ
jgi:hypothetical protein